MLVCAVALLTQGQYPTTMDVTPGVAKLQPAPANAQTATFSATVNPPAGATYITYSWAASTEIGGASISITSGQNSKTATFKVTGAGVFVLQGSVQFHPPEGPGMVNNVALRRCIALGGPITLRVIGRAADTYSNDGAVASNPWYAQWFGHNGTAPPAGCQPAQYIQATAPYQPQKNDVLDPIQTKIEWTVPGAFSCPAATGSNQPAQINLVATAIAKGSQLRAKFSVTGVKNLQNGPALTGSAMDDTDGSTENGVALTSKLSAHQPTSSDVVSQTPYFPNGASLANAWCGSLVSMKLLDESGDAMPGVWVQERFTGTKPSGFSVNDDKMFWTSSKQAPGIFETDHLFYYWPNVPSPPVTLTATHTYWAATQNTVANGGGLDVGTYKITLTSGQPGSASQQKQ